MEVEASSRSTVSERSCGGQLTTIQMEPETDPPSARACLGYTLWLYRIMTTPIKVGVIWMVIISCALSTSFPAIAIPTLIDTGMDLTPTQVSLVGTMRQVGIIIGALMIGPLLDNWGRRKGTLLSIIPAIAGYGTMFASDCVVAVCTGLVLLGVAMGMINSSASVYLAEALSKEWRGAIGVSRQVVMSVGTTLTYVLALIIQVTEGKIQRIALIAMVTTCVSFFLAICFVSETKIWSEQSTTSGGQKKKRKSFGEAYTDFFRALISRPDIYKPFCILNFLNFLRHGSGAGVITNYTINMIVDAGATSDPYVIAVTLGVFRIAGSVIGAVLSKVLGRRSTMLGAGITMTIAMIALSLLQYVDNWPKFAPEVFLTVFISTSVIFQSISLSMQGEIYPTDFRGMCSSATTTLSNVEATLILFTYPLAKSWVGSGFVLAVYAVSSASCVVFMHYTVPNTDNKTLDEIAKMFQQKSSVDVQDEAVPLRTSELNRRKGGFEKSRNDDIEMI